MTNEMRIWIDALRSGKYEQTQRQLRREDSFCCLGVLCDLYDPQGWDGDFHHEFGMYPPKQVFDWLGIIDTGDSLEVQDEDGHWINVAVMNDEGASFDEIADALERTYGDDNDS